MRVNIRRPPKNPERNQRVDVLVEPHDVWSLDWTLAQIIHPGLVMLKEKKFGAPKVDPEDVPLELRPTTEELAAYQEQGETDGSWFDRYDYILDEMIWAFDLIKQDVTIYSKAENERLTNALRLFGKYYRSLWW
jgi:hypothetical protein